MKKINETKNSKKANATINKIYEEMKYAEEYLKKLNVTWDESFEDIYSMDIYYLRRSDHQKVKELEQKYYNQYLLLDENVDKRSGQPLKKITLSDEDKNIYDCEFGIIKWNSYNKTTRDITFKNNGDIKYLQQSSYKKSKRNDYVATYNVNNLDLSITFKIDKDILKYSTTNSIQTITYNNITIETNLETGINKIIYQDKQANKDIYYEIIIENNNIISRYLKLTYYDFTQEIDMLQEELEEMITDLLEKLYIDNQILNNLKDNSEEIINSIKDNLFVMIKQIKGDVPLQGLSKRLGIALSMIYSKNEKNKLETNKTKQKKKIIN